MIVWKQGFQIKNDYLQENNKEERVIFQENNKNIFVLKIDKELHFQNSCLNGSFDQITLMLKCYETQKRIKIKAKSPKP